ncbi:MAG TPA: DUF4190 domain-containing protein [Candidatus Dormibacteraeota bacterium]
MEPPPPPPPPGQFQSPHPGLPAPPSAGEAVASMVLGILAIFPFCAFGIVLGPLAFLLGQSALRQIRASGGTVGGAGMAEAGRVLGIISTVLWLLGALVFALVLVVGVSSSVTR